MRGPGGGEIGGGGLVQTIAIGILKQIWNNPEW